MSGIPLAPRAVSDLVQRHGGSFRAGAPPRAESRHPGEHRSHPPSRRATASDVVRRLSPIAFAGAGDLAPLLAARYVDDAVHAVARGAVLLVDEALASREDVAALPGWQHPHAAYTLAALLDLADAPEEVPVIGEGCVIGRGAIIMPRVRLGKGVVVGPNAVIGDAGFGFAVGPEGAVRAIPHLGGVVIEDDVHIGAGSTVAAGTLSPTVIRRGAKLDAQVHVGHNCEIGEGTMIAAQTGLAGSVVVGRGVMMGGQVGVADHVKIGDGAKIAGKSGVIGDVAAGLTVAGYPAVERPRWLRGLAEVYRLAANRANSSYPPSSGRMRAGFPSMTPSPPPPADPSVPPPAAVPTGLRPEAIIRRTEPPPPREGGSGT